MRSTSCVPTAAPPSRSLDSSRGSRRARALVSVSFCAGLGLVATHRPASAQSPLPSRFYTVPPCRLVDTRAAAGATGGPALAASATRAFPLAGRCGTSPTARAVAVNVTVTGSAAGGFLTLFPSGAAAPPTSTINFGPGATRANNAVVAPGAGGSLAVFAGLQSGSVHVILDVAGYFDDPANNQPPRVSAGPDRTVGPGGTAALVATYADDGLPSGATPTYQWTKAAGPGAVTFASPAALATTASFAGPGTYTLRFTASDSSIAASDDVLVRVDTTPADLRLFADQATFGATDALASYLQTAGLSAYLDEQIATPSSGFPTFPPMPGTAPADCQSPSVCYRDNYTLELLQRRLFTNALYGSDQLRQRMIWALHKILVVSGRDVTMPSRLRPYLDVLDRNAFGNYRQLLSEITLNPAMGRYLDMVTSTRTNPNENYPREILQLFSIGLEKLNPDGTPQLDGNGDPIPTYDQAVVSGFAKVFTGWTYAAQPIPGVTNYFDPMILVAGNHDVTAKTLFPGITLPAGQTGTKDLNDALDVIFNHPNVGPFLGKQLIQSFVTSNPSPAYVARVAAVFADNGQGVRGDLGAVIKQVLLDPEARSGSAAPDAGKLREPVLFVTQALRALGVRAANGTGQSDGYLNPQTSPMGQDVFRPATVFSYYPPDFLLPGSTTVLAPEFGVLSASTALRRANFVNTIAFSTIPTNTNYPYVPNGTSIDLAPLQALAASPAALVDRLDQLLTHQTLSAAAKQTIVTAVNAVAATNTLLRAQTAAYLVLTSSQFQVER